MSEENPPRTRPLMSQQYDKLKALLKELFQLDQPDQDFGPYKPRVRTCGPDRRRRGRVGRAVAQRSAADRPSRPSSST